MEDLTAKSYSSKPGPNSLGRLYPIGAIQWCSKDKTLETVFGIGCESDNLLFELVCTFHAISENCEMKPDVRYEGRSLMTNYLQLEVMFVAYSYIYLRLFPETTPLSENTCKYLTYKLHDQNNQL